MATTGRQNLVPPDGGYGWVVACSYALNNIVVLPLISGFGLVFQEAFDETHLSATQGSLIITLNHGFGMLLSFFGGPLLRRFGYRKVAVSGALFVAVGVMLTSYANSFWMFIFTYSILTSIGVASVMAAFTLAINSFFKEKRGRAIGLGMSITGLGPILMPLLMNVLISEFGWRYAVLILGALCLHSLLAATMLRPAKWYLKPAPTEPEEMVPLNKQLNIDLVESSGNLQKVTNGTGPISTKLNHLENDRKLNFVEPPKSISMRSLSSCASLQSRNAISHPDVRKQKPEPAPGIYKWWESQEINLGSSINIFNEPKGIAANANDKEAVEEDDKSTKKHRSLFAKQMDKIVEFFDLGLLKDPVFVNILFGLSIAACAEINFSLLLPLILKDMLKFDTGEIATLMSVIGFSDLLFRLVSPFIGDWCHKPPRVMYLASLLMIVFTRTTMLFAATFQAMLFVALAIGVTKGIRTVYMNIVIPSYVPLERLPFASGIQMFVNGVILITFGPLLGRIREASGSYMIPIILLNIVTLLTVTLWTLEFLYFRIRKPSLPEDPPA